MKRKVPEGQYDLFGEAEAAEVVATTQATDDEARRARLRAYDDLLEVDCCTGEPYPDARRRCGRCGELVVNAYILSINHDLGWGGCFGRHHRFQSAEEMSEGRHDNLHHPRCARCGHAWGIHRWAGMSDDPEHTPCYGWCGCSGYLSP